MKCYECIYMDEFEEGFCRCTNHDSTNYMMPTGYCSDDDCYDGEYLVCEEVDEEWGYTLKA